MERRVFVAILLSFAVLYGYQALFVPPQKPKVDVVERAFDGHNPVIIAELTPDTRGPFCLWHL